MRAWFAKRVCVVGAESTGTTTLAKTLAELLQTAWVEEYGREYSEIKLAKNDPDWRSEEFTAIAEEQTRREDDAARRSESGIDLRYQCVCDRALASAIYGQP